MAGKSSISRLAPAIKAAVDELIRDGRATVDEIVAHIRQLGGDASRSAVHRYKVSAEASMDGLRKSQAFAEVWVSEARKDPEGKTSRLLAELIKTAAFNTLIEQVGEDAAVADPKDLMFLGATIKSIASAEKIGIERERMIREDAAKQAAKAIETAGRAQGLTADTVAALRKAVLKGGA